MQTSSSIRSVNYGCLLFTIYVILASPAYAFNLNPKHHIEKATTWVAVKSGLKPTGDNINAATTNTAQAAQATETAVKELSPKANAAMESITRTSDAAGTILLWIKWPLVGSVYCLAFWFASLAFKGWRSISIQARPLTVPESPVSTPVTTRGRIILIALGASAFFAAFYMLYLDGSEMFREQGELTAYMVLGAVSSLVAGIVLFWLPVRRTWSCLMVGFFSPILAFVAMAYFMPQSTQAAQTLAPQPRHCITANTSTALARCLSEPYAHPL